MYYSIFHSSNRYYYFAAIMVWWSGRCVSSLCVSLMPVLVVWGHINLRELGLHAGLSVLTYECTLLCPHHSTGCTAIHRVTPTYDFSTDYQQRLF